MFLKKVSKLQHVDDVKNLCCFYSATDCINGTIYETKTIPRPYITFRQFWNLTGKHRNVVDPNNQYVPAQFALTIYNTSRLYINLDGCVNTLKGECLDFLQTHGRDGRNQTAQSRYHCFYNKVSLQYFPRRYSCLLLPFSNLDQRKFDKA